MGWYYMLQYMGWYYVLQYMGWYYVLQYMGWYYVLQWAVSCSVHDVVGVREVLVCGEAASV